MKVFIPTSIDILSVHPEYPGARRPQLRDCKDVLVASQIASRCVAAVEGAPLRTPILTLRNG